VLVLASGLTAPLLAITNSVTWGWLDVRTLGLALGGVAVLAYFVRLERRTVSPLLDMRIVLQRRVAFANAASVLVGFASYSGFLLISLLAQVPKGAGYGLGLGPAGSGLVMAPGCLAMVVMGALSGRLRHRVQARTVLAIGGVASALGLILIALSPGSRVHVAIAAALLLSGVGLAIASMSNLVIDAVPSGQTGEATGVNTVARVIGAALGSQVAVTILAAGTQGEGSPSERAFVFAFLVSASFALSAAVVGFGIKPRAFDKNYADD
jgi:MFS family permease